MILPAPGRTDGCLAWQSAYNLHLSYFLYEGNHGGVLSLSAAHAAVEATLGVYGQLVGMGCSWSALRLAASPLDRTAWEHFCAIYSPREPVHPVLHGSQHPQRTFEEGRSVVG